MTKSEAGNNFLFHCCVFSNYDVESALEALPGKLASYLVLWTSMEQQRIGHAFERVKINLFTLLIPYIY